MYESCCSCYVRALTTFQTSLCITELEKEIPQLVPPTLGTVARPLQRRCRLINQSTWDPRLRMMGCFARFCCKRGAGVDQRPKAGFEFLLAWEQSSGSMRFQLRSGLFPVGFQLFSSDLTTCQKYWPSPGRRGGDIKPFQTVELEQMLMHMQVFYILGRYLSIRRPRGPFTRTLVH